MKKNKKNNFLQQIENFVIKKYGKDKAKDIMHKAYYRYTELCIENKEEAKEFHIHTRERIYPSIAMFDALVANNISREDAKGLISLFYSWRSAKVGKALRTFLKFPFLYRFVPSIAYSKTDLMFNEKIGFQKEILVHTKKEYSFNMTSCLYYNTCKKYNCPEIVTIFCDADFICFGSMHKNIVFERSKTLATNDDCCDFQIRIEK